MHLNGMKPGFDTRAGAPRGRASSAGSRRLSPRSACRRRRSCCEQPLGRLKVARISRRFALLRVDLSTTALRDSKTKPALACETMTVRNSKFYVLKFGMSCQMHLLN